MATHIDRAIHKPACPCLVRRFLNRHSSIDRVGSEPRKAVPDDILLLGLVKDGGQVGRGSADGDEDVNTITRCHQCEIFHRDTNAIRIELVKIKRGAHVHAARLAVTAEALCEGDAVGV